MGAQLFNLHGTTRNLCLYVQRVACSPTVVPYRSHAAALVTTRAASKPCVASACRNKVVPAPVPAKIAQSLGLSSRIRELYRDPQCHVQVHCSAPSLPMGHVPTSTRLTQGPSFGCRAGLVHRYIVCYQRRKQLTCRPAISQRLERLRAHRGLPSSALSGAEKTRPSEPSPGSLSPFALPSWLFLLLSSCHILGGRALCAG